jgi:glycerol-3-phosphate cytidylyltransferase
MCDKLIVGVTTDELVSYKNKKAVIPHNERMEIVRAIRYVDSVVPQEDMGKIEMWKKLKFDVMFVGDDWYASDKWEELEKQFKEVGVRIVFFPYTKGTSSTILNQTLKKLRNNEY